MSIFKLTPEKKAFFWTPTRAVFLQNHDITHRCAGDSPYKFILSKEHAGDTLEAVMSKGKELSLILNQRKLAVLEYHGLGNREITVMGEQYKIIAKGGLSGTYTVPGCFELTMDFRRQATLTTWSSRDEWTWTALAISYFYWFRFWFSD